MVTLRDASPRLRELIDPTEEFQTLGSGFIFTEGPAWLPREKALHFTDLQGDARWRWSEATGAVQTAHPAFKANGMTPGGDGSLLICEHVTSSVVRLRPNGDREVVAFHYEGTYLNSPNDVVMRSDGSVWFTDSDYGRWDHVVGVARPFELGFQGVYRVPPGGGPTRLVVAKDEFDQPNGLCFSPDESVLYIDDVTGIKAFDVHADGTLSPPRVVHAGMGGTGRGDPDGMRCDEQGNLWCTGPDGIWVFAPDGELLGVVETPEICANLTWGGDDWRTLFICSSTTVRSIRTRVASAPLTRSN
jgi:gluconolactonase